MSQITDDHDYLMAHNILWLGLAKNTYSSPSSATLIVYFSRREISLFLVSRGLVSCSRKVNQYYFSYDGKFIHKVVSDRCW